MLVGLARTISDPLVLNRCAEGRQVNWLTAAALTFLKTRDTARPFLTYLAYHEPHQPILEYPRQIDHFREKAAQIPSVVARLTQLGDDLAAGDPARCREACGKAKALSSVL